MLPAYRGDPGEHPDKADVPIAANAAVEFQFAVPKPFSATVSDGHAAACAPRLTRRGHSSSCCAHGPFGRTWAFREAVVEPIHPKAMPVILTTDKDDGVWMRAPRQA